VIAMDTLVMDTLATHHGLEERLARARAGRARDGSGHPRDAYGPIDTFLAMASRHNAALLQVLVPAVRSHLDDGHRKAKEFTHQSRRFEGALSQVKAKLYGSTYAVHRSWPSLWEDVEREFEDLWQMEHQLAEELTAQRRDGDPDWGEKLHRAEVKAPTRPHPNIPHHGVRGKVARMVARRVDAFWDTAEGRMVPEPYRHHERENDGPFVQYLTSSPHLTPRPPKPRAERPERPEKAQRKPVTEDLHRAPTRENEGAE